MLSKTSRCFVHYRLPREKKVRSIIRATVKKINAGEIDFSADGFVVFPFEGEEGFFISDEGESITEITEPDPEINSETDKEIYLESCRNFISEIRKGTFEKLVLSRVQHAAKKKSPDEIFINLCEAYPDAFVFHYLVPGWGEWMGASPEMLAGYENGIFTAVALAGTQSLKGKATGDIKWEEKDKKEQQYVRDYLEMIFAINGCNAFEKGKTSTLQAGNIVHLKTIYKLPLPHEKFSSLVKSLHPTPAVCGVPKEKAREFIIKNENHRRKLYTGFSGPVFKNDSAHLFVTLRCMQVHGNMYEIFTGGGITSLSDAEKEWEETEVKAKTLLAFL